MTRAQRIIFLLERGVLLEYLSSFIHSLLFMLPNRLLRARRLFIRNVTITAPIGAYEHEKKAPQRLITFV